jgi:hypothetical protein
MTNYPTTLVTLVPDALIRYAGVDVDYSDIEWLDDRPQPTQKECDDAWPQINYDLEYSAVERARRRRYNEETDGMFFAAQRGDGDLTAWIAAVDAIKADLPYPQPPKK